MIYRREIDGLRALAVLPVMLFHAGMNAFSGGFVGVDVFFVISGYLITSIITAELRAGTFTLIGFYERRARRILPALFLVIIACIPFALLLMSPRELKDFGQSVVAVSLFSSNVLFWFESGYFNSAAELKPLLHTWSLAVEEQYYVIFPLLLMFTWRLGERAVVLILSAILVVSLGLSQWGAINSPDAAFYLLHMRGWELLIGALCAFYLHSSPPRGQSTSAVNQLLASLGLFLIGYAVFAFDELTNFPGVNALFPTIGAALIIIFGVQGTYVGRLLGSRPFVALGLISYSAYLWHQPLFAFARLHSAYEPALGLFIFLAIASLVLAYFTWRYVEWPFRDKRKLGRSTIFMAGAAVSGVFIVLGATIHVSNGFHYQYRMNLTGEERVLFDLVERHIGGDQVADMPDDKKCMFWRQNVDAEFRRRFDACRAKHGPAIVVLGDSHAMNIYGALFRNDAAEFLVGLSQGRCRPHANLPKCHYDEFTDFVRERSADIERVIYNQAGFYLLRNTDGSDGGRKMFMREQLPQFPVDDVHAQKTLAYLGDLAKYVEVTWLGPYLELHFSRRQLFSLLRNGYEVREELISNYDRLDSELEKLVKESGKSIEYVSLLKQLVFGEKTKLVEGDCLTYRDGDHLSVCGEKAMGKLILQVVKRK